MNLGTKLFSWLVGRQVGTDAAGNRYFIEREPRRHGVRPRRWVLYPGAADPSRLPAGWLAWLNHGQDAKLAAPGPGPQP
jgi:NADH:ubiquinone oxidoreductase subunit